MCGISGIYGAGASVENISQMIAAQFHRGPDACGIFSDDQAPIVLGHNRLSIIDLNPASNQPMTIDTKTKWLVFNGEIYNYKALRRRLKDYRFNTNSDTEVILAAWEKWGPECVHHFIGMFAFAIWDKDEKALFVVRDRLGIKPLCYLNTKDTFYFASEIKGIASVIPQISPNESAISYYLSAGLYDHSSETFFRDIKYLPPGHIGKIKNGTLTIEEYWNVEDFHIACEGNASDTSDEFLELFKDSVSLRMQSDVSFGLNLSGGIDSSLLMHAINQHAGHYPQSKISTYTAVFGDRRYDEDIHAERVGEASRFKRHSVKFDLVDTISALSDGVYFQESPYGGIATLAYEKLHRFARADGQKVLLEGQGADELFGGYRYYLAYYLADLMRAKRGDDLAVIFSNLDPMEVEFWKHKSNEIMNGKSLQVHYDGSSHIKAGVVSTELANLHSQDRISKLLPSTLREAQIWDIKHAKLPRVLRMNDRLSMMHSIELREPFIDHRIVEFAMRLKPEHNLKCGIGKEMQRRILARNGYHSFAFEKKRNVVTPQREWLRTSLFQEVTKMANDYSDQMRDYFNMTRFREELRQYGEGKGDNSFFIWQFMNLVAFQNKFFKGLLRPKPLDGLYDQVNITLA